MGLTEQVIGLRAVPDYAGRARQQSLDQIWGATLNGKSGVILGYDRGNAALSFQGPVNVVQNVAAALNAHGSAAGIYKPQLEFKDAAGGNPNLDPFRRLMYARMVANQ